MTGAFGCLVDQNDGSNDRARAASFKKDLVVSLIVFVSVPLVTSN
jgi:hypothetical protein